MKLLNLKRKTTQKVAVLATGLVAALLVSTVGPLPAQAFPSKAANCANCHAVGGSTTAAPSTLTPAAGATYTVAITLAANPAGGLSGYAIVPVAPAVEKANGGNSSSALSYSATMTAPTAAGTYRYNVYTNQGGTDPSGFASGTSYSITVAGAPVAVATTTALAVSPASAVAPASATLTATVSGAGAAGTVEFFSGAISLGTSVVANGVATKALTGVVAGSYSYTAKFIPTSAAAFTPSTSSAATFVVTAPVPVAVTTTTALAVSPASAVAPASATLTATVSGAGAAGTVQFLNGTTVLGTSPVAAGSATLALTGVVAGSYSYTAKFIPTSAAAFTPSTSSAVAFVVTAPVPVAVTTTTALAVSPASAVAPASATLTATVSGAGAAGTVEFFNGAASLGTSVVANGVATKALTGVVAGSYSYTAKFIPTSAAAFTPSTSSAVAFVVTAPVPVAVTTTTALAVSPVSAVAPASATLTATVSGAGAAGTVEFFSGIISLGTSPVAAGVATKPLVGLVEGSYSYTAKFIPTSAAAFTPSTSSAVTFLVTALVPAPTASFTASALTGIAPVTLTMTDTSIGAPTSWAWTFGNGTTSTVRSPLVTYAVAGTYTVTLIASNAIGASAPVSQIITVSAPVPAAVTTTTALAVSPVSAVAPASATLTATVSGAGAAGTVEFFSGAASLGTSPVANGVATKALTGVVAGSYSYTAKFIPTSAAAFTPSTSSAVTFLVTAPVPAPTASFTASALTGIAPVTLTMTDTSIGAPTSWAWTFGNGTTSTVRSPLVTYTAAGTYTVTLIASNAIGASAPVSQTITVTAPGVPSAATIVSLSETHGEVGKWVVIRGSGFGAAGVVKFGAVNATAAYWSATRIYVKVPAGNVAGTVGVTVTPTGGTASNAVPFRVESDGDDEDESNHS